MIAAEKVYSETVTFDDIPPWFKCSRCMFYDAKKSECWDEPTPVAKAPDSRCSHWYCLNCGGRYFEFEFSRAEYEVNKNEVKQITLRYFHNHDRCEKARYVKPLEQYTDRIVGANCEAPESVQ